MATGKVYYWIKLRKEFLTSETVQFLMSQDNNDGAKYVVLYQMLCLMTINTDGRMERMIGEVLIPYDVEKIRQDCKYFSADTIKVALDLYARLGLIYRDQDGCLILSDHGKMVGKETDYAEKQRLQRKKNAALLTGDISGDNVSTEIRDKSKEIRDKSLENKNNEFVELAGDDKELLEALKAFENMRKKIKKPIEDRARTMLVNKLKEFPREDWIAIIDQSIFHNWQSFYPLKATESYAKETWDKEPIEPPKTIRRSK